MNFFISLGFLLLSLSFVSNATESMTYYIIEDSATPFQIVNKNQRPSGIVSDILYAISSDITKIQPTVLPFYRMIKEMNSKESRNWVSYGSKTWEGPQSTVLSRNSLLKIEHRILTLKKNQYRSIKDLFGKRVVLIRGFQYPGLNRYIKSGQIEAVSVRSHDSAIKAIEIGRAYAFPEMEIRLKYHMKKYKYDEELYSYHDFSKVISNYDINFCFSKDFPKERIRDLDKKVLKLKKNGKIEEIINSYIQ